jgi:hypothetical protein
MSEKRQSNGETPAAKEATDQELVELKIQIPAGLYRAYQRCSWIITNETGRQQLDIMEEMVNDFLVKNEC